MATVSILVLVRPLPIDEAVAAERGALRVRIHEAGRRLDVNDLWIATAAVAHRLPVPTQNADFDVLSEIGALEVI